MQNGPILERLFSVANINFQQDTEFPHSHRAPLTLYMSDKLL